jgi:hypothetical protein
MYRQTALIPIEHQVDLAKLYEYYNLKSQMLKARQKFFKLYDSSLELAGRYLSELPEAEQIKFLRREIRIATRGTPQTIAEDAVTVAGYVSAQTEMLYNAQAHLVKSAWQKVAPLVHPDRRQGDTELFQTALAAYRLKDLTYLQDLFITLQKDNVFWRCSKESREYLDTEIQRPDVSLQRLRTKPEFQIVMLDRSGKPDKAKEFASLFAQRLILILQAELHYLLVGPDETEPQVDVPNVKDVEDGNPEEESSEEGGRGSEVDEDRDWSEGPARW